MRYGRSSCSRLGTADGRECRIGSSRIAAAEHLLPADSNTNGAALNIEHNNNFDVIRLFAALQVLHFHADSVISLPGTPDWLMFVIRQFPGVTVFLS
jgi:hypothetical protein